MHPSLRIEEILLNIFGHCHLETASSDLAALARTCCAFKEPALDVLWETLPDPSPLARCLPQASRHRQLSAQGIKCYSFSRSLAQDEWSVLRGYTRRIRSMLDHARGLDWESVGTFLNPPITQPLFPNLRHLHCGSAVESMGLLYMPFPSLTTLSVGFRHKENLHVLQRSLESLSKFSSNIKRLSIRLKHPNVTFTSLFSSRIRRWQYLQTVNCGSVALTVDALIHLSRMPALTQLTFTASATLPDQISPSDSPLVFANLHNLTLYSDVLDPISWLLSKIRLPAVGDFRVFIQRCPSKLDISSLFSSLQTSGIGRAIQGLLLEQSFPTDRMYVAKVPRQVLDWEDLHPFTAFSNLRHISFNIEWDVDLPSSKLLALVSAWPCLKHLAINAGWGWNTQGGVTPNELLQLLQTCRSLSRITLAVDTRGYTEVSQLPAGLGLTLPPTFSINVVDSLIEPKSVTAIAAFLANFATRSNFAFLAWGGWVMEDTGCMDLWYKAYKQANNVVKQGS